MKKSVLIPHERYVYYQNLAKHDATRSLGDATLSSAPLKNQSVVQEADVQKQSSEQVVSQIETPNNSDSIHEDVILAHLPQRNKNKAKALLTIVRNNPKLDWDKTGQLLVQNDVVPFSHITDLLHDALNNTKYDPVGHLEFYGNLGNIPQSLIVNKRRKELLGGKQLPPPGIPDTEPQPLNSWKSQWKAL